MVSDCQPCAERQTALLGWAQSNTPLLLAAGVAVGVFVLWPHLIHP